MTDTNLHWASMSNSGPYKRSRVVFLKGTNSLYRVWSMSDRKTYTGKRRIDQSLTELFLFLKSVYYPHRYITRTLVFCMLNRCITRDELTNYWYEPALREHEHELSSSSSDDELTRSGTSLSDMTTAKIWNTNVYQRDLFYILRQQCYDLYKNLYFPILVMGKTAIQSKLDTYLLYYFPSPKFLYALPSQKGMIESRECGASNYS